MDHTKILFVCLGNICRSPAAHAIMQQKVEEAGLVDYIETDSAGIGNWHAGQLPDSRMRRHGQKRGYKLTHRARQFHAETDFKNFDIIVVMDEENYKAITSKAGNNAESRKVIRMADYFKEHNSFLSVPDPYYGGDKDFELAFDLIEEGCDGLLSALTGKHS